MLNKGGHESGVEPDIRLLFLDSKPDKGNVKKTATVLDPELKFEILAPICFFLNWLFLNLEVFRNRG